MTFFSFKTFVLLMLSWLPLYALLGQMDDLRDLANIVTMLIIFIGCLMTALRSIAENPVQLWYPFTWFLFTASAYYGFGPLLHYFGTEETVNYSNQFFPVGSVELYHVSILNLIAIVVVMLVYMKLKKLFPNKIYRGKLFLLNIKDHKELKRLFFVFALIGIPIKLLLLPHTLGLTEEVLPNGFTHLGVFSTLALVPIYILLQSDKSRFTTPFTILLSFELITAFITLSKMAVLKVGIVLVMAAVLTGIKFKRILVIGVIGLLIYSYILVPLITISRVQFRAQGLTNFQDASSAVSSFYQGGQSDIADLLPGVQAWWSRLDYSTAQAFAIQAYDTGYSGDSLMLIFYAFIPRALYPDKPIMTVGDQFNLLVTGNPDSKSAPGFFAEAYWNGGWLLAFIIFIGLGFIYWGWEKYISEKLEKKQLVYLPVMWMGLFSAAQQDSWFIATAIGPIATALVFNFIIKWLLESFIVRKAVSHKLY